MLKRPLVCANMVAFRLKFLESDFKVKYKYVEGAYIK